MNELAIYDQFHELLPIESGIPRKLNSYAISGATAYHCKVIGNGYILFQNLKGPYLDIWLTHYLFTRPTTLYCKGKMTGIELHHVIEGAALYQDEENIWHHCNQGDHDILFNTTFNNEARFSNIPVVTLDIHMSVKEFKNTLSKLPRTKWIINRINAKKKVRLVKNSSSPNVGLQAIITQIYDEIQAGNFDFINNEELCNELIKVTIFNNSENCGYKYSTDDIRRILEAKMELEMNLGVKKQISNMFQISLMGKKKFTEGFKLVAGLPPSSFVLAEKIKASKVMMEKQNDLSNEDFALILGFTSGSHFLRTFKKYEGYSPKEYRKMRGFDVD